MSGAKNDIASTVKGNSALISFFTGLESDGPGLEINTRGVEGKSNRRLLGCNGVGCQRDIACASADVLFAFLCRLLNTKLTDGNLHSLGSS